jgi:hypothetical protein
MPMPNCYGLSVKKQWCRLAIANKLSVDGLDRDRLEGGPFSAPSKDE